MRHPQICDRKIQCTAGPAFAFKRSKDFNCKEFTDDFLKGRRDNDANEDECDLL